MGHYESVLWLKMALARLKWPMRSVERSGTRFIETVFDDNSGRSSTTLNLNRNLVYT